MSSVSKLFSSSGLASMAGHGVGLPPQVSRFKVRLARTAFYEVEVFAPTADEAMRIAEQQPPAKPRLDFYTTPTAFRAEVFQPWDQQWVKVPRS